MAAEVLLAPLLESLQSIFEMDEVYQEPLPDGRLRVVFLTTGISDNLVRLKTYLLAALNLPVQIPEEVKVHQDQAGALFKRYRIEVVLKPLFKWG